jgi:hypothetical protein
LTDFLQAATERLNAGAFAEAASLYGRAIGANAADENAWRGLVLALALQRQIGAIVGLADKRQGMRGDGFAFFNDAATLLLSYKLYAHAVELDRILPEASTYKASSLYYAGCVHLLNDDEDAAFDCFARLKPILAERRDELPIASEDRFNIAYRQATLIEDAAYVDGLDRGALLAKAALPSIQWQGDPAPSEAGFTLLAACDSRYFVMFATRFLESVEAQDQGLGVHLHIAAADETAQALAYRLAQSMGRNRLTISTEPASRHAGGAYYSCCRFLAAAELRSRLAQPVMITDIDIAFTKAPREIAALASDFDFASFEHDGFGPCSRLPAVLTWFGGEPEGTEALDALRAFILSKLHISWPWNWMLDQAGLMALRRWLGKCRPDASVGRLNDRLAGSFDKVLLCLGDEDEKAALIRSAVS